MEAMKILATVLGLTLGVGAAAAQPTKSLRDQTLLAVAGEVIE